MSNRRRLTPPPAVQRYAAAYRCTDCTGRVARTWRDTDGVWHLTVEHDDGCPVLAGTVDAAGASLAAAIATGHTGIAYLERGGDQ